MNTETITPSIEAPILLKRNEEEIATFLEFKKDAESRISACLASFRELGQGDLTLQKLSDLYYNEETIDNLVRERITGGKPAKVNGIPLSAAKWKEMVDVPDYSSFRSNLDHLKTIDKSYKRGIYQLQTLNLLDFEEVHGQGVMKEAVLENYIKSQSTFVETPEDKEAYQLAIEALERITELSERFGIHLTAYDVNSEPLILQRFTFGDGWRTSLDLYRFKRLLDVRAGRIRAY